VTTQLQLINIIIIIYDKEKTKIRINMKKKIYVTSDSLGRGATNFRRV